MNKAKILFWDIETTPNIVTSFSLDNKQPIHHQNIVQERSVLCISWKWLGKSHIDTVVIDPKNPTNDRNVLLSFSDIAKHADAVVAHYGDEFDIKFVNARLAFHKLSPLPNTIQIDTYKMARSKFYFNNNKLDYLASFLGFGKKIRTNFDLWKDCMAGNSVALRKMIKYNRHDVILLEKVYNALAPFVKSKVSASTSEDTCTNCGLHSLKKEGTRRSIRALMQQFQCRNCGHWQSKKV